MGRTRQEVEAEVRRQAELDREIESKIARQRRNGRLLVILMAVVLMLVLLGGLYAVLQRVSRPEPGAADFFAQALKLHDDGETTQSTIALKKVLVEEPEHIEARWLLGQGYLALGEGRAAEKEIRHARLLGRQGLDVQYALLESLLFERRYTEILIETIGIANEPGHNSAILRAEAQLGLKRYDKVEATLQEVLVDDDAAVNALQVSARLDLARDSVSSAARTTEQIVKLAPGDAQTEFIRARVALMQGRYGESRRLFDQLMKMMPGHPEGRVGKAQAFLAEGSPDPALQELRQIKGIKADIVKYLSAVAYVQKGDIQAARADLRKFLKRNPEHLDAIMLLAQINHTQRELRQAESGLGKLLTLSPQDLGALKLLASIHLDVGQLREVDAVLERALEIAPQDSELLALQARAMLANGEDEAAEELLGRATALAVEQGHAATADAADTQWRLQRCGILVHYCSRCLTVRECR